MLLDCRHGHWNRGSKRSHSTVLVLVLVWVMAVTSEKILELQFEPMPAVKKMELELYNNI
jgi:hypothetical protein